MKSKSDKTTGDLKTKLWDAFVSYLEDIYFPDASVLLDKRTIAFEYECFVHCYQ